VWASTREEDVDAMVRAREQIRREAEAEYRRLLYVAMTRAAEYLIVCGAQGVNGRPPGCWYDLVFEMLTPHAEKTERHGAAVWRWRPGAALQTAAVAPAGTEPADLPDWLQRDAIQASATQSVAPSRASGTEAPMRLTGTPGGARATAIQRGLIIHRLLQSLPDVTPERRLDAARRHLARHHPHVAEELRDELISSVLGLLDDPRFAALFGAGTQAEVPIVGHLARDGCPALRVSGQVDRLAVTDESVFIADYKTNRPAARQLSEVPEDYVLQLALYRAILAQVFPGRRVRAGLLWTEGPDLMELPEPMLDAAARVALMNRP
jgi:ATP-dependent helicase/nuclease subunit A